MKFVKVHVLSDQTNGAYTRGNAKVLIIPVHWFLGHCDNTGSLGTDSGVDFIFCWKIYICDPYLSFVSLPTLQLSLFSSNNERLHLIAYQFCLCTMKPFWCTNLEMDGSPCSYHMEFTKIAKKKKVGLTICNQICSPCPNYASNDQILEHKG